MTNYNRKKLSGILYLVIVYVVVVMLVATNLAFSFETIVSQVFNQPLYKSFETGAAVGDSNYFKSDYTSLDALIADETEYAKQVHAEGVVLLQNRNLPLTDADKTVALLGADSKDSVYRNGGAGSGAINAQRAPIIAEAFEAAGFTVDRNLVSFYESRTDAVAVRTTTQEPPITELPDFSADVGIVFIGRSGGEGYDLAVSDLTISDVEKELIELSLQKCGKTVVLVNSSNPVGLGYLEGKEVSALWTGASGEIGIGVIPEILKGTMNPSGKLVDVYAYDCMSAPAALNYGDWNLTNVEAETVGNKYVNYGESIYFGYRYYETRYADKVMGTGNAGNYDYASTVQYPFGYGLSYTTFQYSNFSLSEAAGTVTLSVTVTNTGSMAGRETVQFYMQSPYTQYDIANGVEKSAVELVQFGKTQSLAPGASEALTVTVSKEMMKAYDYQNAKTYIVDAGDYYFTAAANVHEAINNILAAQGYTTADGMTADGNAAMAGHITQAELDSTTWAVSAVSGVAVNNLFETADLRYYLPETVYLTRNDWAGTFPKQAADMEATQQMIDDLGYDVLEVADLDETGAVMPTTGAQNGLTLASMLAVNEDGTVTKQPFDSEYWDQLIDQMSEEELMDLFAIGGYQTLGINSVGKPQSSDQDGPATLGGAMMGGTATFNYPAEILLASTWNLDLARQMGYFVGEDGLMTGVTGWYAPGMNIHRTPMAGRNFEYYSEDPVQSGLFSAVVTEAAQNKGIVVYAKHFFLNDQETNRSTVCTFATEQAIREIYLKPFEYSVIEGGAKGIMNSMNRIGMVWAGAHEGALAGVLRNEWNWTGIMITDATLATSYKMQALPTLLAGTDLMLCTNKGIFEIADYASSPTVMTALRQSARRILYSFADSSVMNGISSSTKIVKVTPDWELILVIVDFLIICAAVVGIILITVKLLKPRKEAEQAPKMKE